MADDDPTRARLPTRDEVERVAAWARDHLKNGAPVYERCWVANILDRYACFLERDLGDVAALERAVCEAARALIESPHALDRCHADGCGRFATRFAVITPWGLCVCDDDAHIPAEREDVEVLLWADAVRTYEAARARRG